MAKLVKFITADTLRLEGLLHDPSPQSSRKLAADAAIVLHGAGSNFYGGTLIERLAPHLTHAGLAVLRMNTRGHDSVATGAFGKERRPIGTAYEIVDDCRLDIQAGIHLLLAEGYARIALLGHSLGAIKAIYSQALAPHEAVSHVIALSPPRLSHAAFRLGPQGADFFTAWRQAETHMKQGRPEALLEIRFPLPMLITARSFLDKYGPGERYNLLKFAGKLTVPTLFTFGERELVHGGIAFAGLDDELRQLGTSAAASWEVQTIAGADHNYTDCWDLLAQHLLAWPQW